MSKVWIVYTAYSPFKNATERVHSLWGSLEAALSAAKEIPFHEADHVWVRLQPLELLVSENQTRKYVVRGKLL